MKKPSTKKKSTTILKKGRNVSEMISVLDDKIKELSSIRTPITSTDGHKITADTDFGAIKQHYSARGLIKVYGYVLNEEKKYEAAILEMGLNKKTAPELLLSGFTAKEWKDDILIRFEEIDRIESLEKLENAKAELKKHLSKEEKLQDSLSLISDILKK